MISDRVLRKLPKDITLRMRSSLDATQTTHFKQITQCFVRKDHQCGKYLGASKSCFIACPSGGEIETLLALISEKLSKLGIETVIAIKERAYGQDIFCTKICGKIIESQFCIVILDDTIKKINKTSINIPNPNVYYEYGLMTSLGKYIIPLQQKEQLLAFNIQTHDTIKYTPVDLSVELDRAFRDAIKITAENRTQEQRADTSEYLFVRSLEINGYQRKDYNWFLDDDISDTVFRGFVNTTRRENILFIFVDDKKTLLSALVDAQVIIKRLESKYDDFSKKIISLNERIEKASKEIEEYKRQEKSESLLSNYRMTLSKRSLESVTERNDLLSKLELIQNSKFCMILSPETITLKDKVIEQYNNVKKDMLPLSLYVGDISGIEIGSQKILFTAPIL